MKGARGAERACLGEAELAAFARGAPRDLLVDEHLQHCLACRNALAEAHAEERFLGRFAEDLAGSRRDVPGPPSAEPHPTLDGYEVLEEVERGGQGVVYRALHEASGRVVALKVVRAGSYRRRARLEREARLAARLRHPNIVALHDCGELQDGRYALALELVDGARLDEWSRRIGESTGGSPRSAPREARRRRLELFEKLCDAVEHAHRHGVIHRDLKPDNILVDRDDEPHVLDFGIARGAEEDSDAERVTLTGEIACTIVYASPEQLGGDRGFVDARTDVYSLGVILYELLTGELPQDSELGLADRIRLITQTPIAPPSSRVRAGRDEAIDRDLDTIVLKALAIEPDRRYPTAAALKADIGHFLRGEPIDARRDSVVYLLRTTLRRHRAPIALALVAALAVLGGLLATAVGVVRSREAAIRSEHERARLLGEARRSEAVVEVLREVVPPGNPAPEIGQGSDAHRVIHSISANIEGGLFSDDPVAAAATRLALGDICFDRGALRRAEVEYRQALRLLRERVLRGAAEEDLLLAGAMERLARLLAVRSGAEEARRLAEQASTIRGRLLGHDHPDSLAARIVLAEIALSSGSPDEAERIIRSIDRSGLADPRVSDALLAVRTRVAMERGDRAGALAFAEERTRECLRAFVDTDHRLPLALDDLAAASVEDPPRAERLRALARDLRSEHLAIAPPSLHERVIAEKTALLAAHDPDLVESLVRLGGRLRELDREEEAIDVYDRAIAIAVPHGGPTTVGEADLVFERNMAAVKAGRIVEVLPRLDRCVAELAPLLEPTDWLHLVTRLRELAGVHAVAGNEERARDLIAEALRTIDAVSPTSPHRAWTLIEASWIEIEFGEATRGIALARSGLAGLADADPSWTWHRIEGHLRVARLEAMRGRRDLAAEACGEARRLASTYDASSADRERVRARIDRVESEALGGAGAG